MSPNQTQHGTYSRVAHTAGAAHLVACGVWLGALLATGTAAAVLFPMQREMGPTLEQFSAYPDPHWHIAAGRPMARLFLYLDVLQGTLAIVVGATLPWTLQNAGRAARASRLAVVGVLGGALSYHLMVRAPRMDAHISRFWSAAEAGELETARASKAAFDAMHPGASSALKLLAVLLAAHLVITAYALLAQRKSGARAKARAL